MDRCWVCGSDVEKMGDIYCDPQCYENYKEKKMPKNYKRDAMYYEKCLRDLLKYVNDRCTPISKTSVGYDLNDILAHKYQPAAEQKCVDLDKPNYGMF